jgi:uncharacterized protein YbbC (DUF1343 family)
MHQVQTGLEVLLKERINILKGRRIGLITNQSAVTSDLTPALDAILAAGVNVTTLFAPEHGIKGEFPDGHEFNTSIDARTNLPIYSLYGKTKKPTPEMLSDIDVILFDIQDIGVRFYTFLYTLAYTMQACAENNKPIVVLDRPNPLGGISVEGPVLDTKFSSFVGLYPIPVRYGMTIGELARLFNDEFNINADLEVVLLSGWKREMWFNETNLPWIPPSPNIPTPDTALAYTGTCLLEGTNVSEGRGTATPFLSIGAPWTDSHILSSELNSYSLSGIKSMPIHFIPSVSKYSNQTCSGVYLQISDRTSFQPVLTGVKIIEIIHRLWPNEFRFRDPGQDGRYFFDLLIGTDQVRIDIENGLSAEDIQKGWKNDLAQFGLIRAKYLRY